MSHKLGRATLESLLEDEEDLKMILSRHVIIGQVRMLYTVRVKKEGDSTLSTVRSISFQLSVR